MAFDIHIPGPIIPLIPKALCICTSQNSGTALHHMVTVIVAAVGNELQVELYVVFPVLQCRKLICPIPPAFLHGELLQFRNIFRGKRRSINPEATGFDQNSEIHDIEDLLLIDPYHLVAVARMADQNSLFTKFDQGIPNRRFAHSVLGNQLLLRNNFVLFVNSLNDITQNSFINLGLQRWLSTHTVFLPFPTSFYQAPITQLYMFSGHLATSSAEHIHPAGVPVHDRSQTD